MAISEYLKRKDIFKSQQIISYCRVLKIVCNIYKFVIVITPVLCALVYYTNKDLYI